MKKQIRMHRKLYLWLLVNLAALATFFWARGNRAWMNALSSRVTVPLRRALGRLCYRVDWSVMELLCAVAAVGAVGYLLWSVVAVLRAKGRRASRTVSAVLGAACIVTAVYLGFCALWGVDSAADGFQERSGIVAQSVSTEDLTAVTQYFAQRLSQTADDVPRDEAGAFARDRGEILANGVHAYDAVEAQFPFLAFDDLGAKPVRFSRVMSALDFTGVYCPFTGESNVNMDSPACLLPATVAHELAHQRGVTSEQECNFLAILAATTCGESTYAYSGWLLGYLYLGNALYRADETAWRGIYESLPQSVRTDLRAQTDYWAQFSNGAARKISNRVYDGFLKSYGQQQGLQSYGTVVDLLVVYYREIA